MISNGHDAVAGIKLLLDRDAREEETRVRLVLAEYVAPDLAALGLAERAPDVFQLFRDTEAEVVKRQLDSKRGDGASRATDVASVAVIFAGKMRRWGSVSSDAMRAFEVAHRPHYIECRNELFQARIKTTHVKAVLRPFNARYLDAWAAENFNNLNFDEIQVRVNNLLEQRIENEMHLQKWADNVYSLFKDVAVVKDATTAVETIARDRKRPLGAIGERSERTYSQQWARWFKENRTRLMRETFEAPPVSLGSSTLGYGFSQQAAPVALGSYAASSFIPSQAIPTASANPLTIRVQTADSPALESETSFSSRDEAIQGAKNWFAFLRAIWGESDRTVKIELQTLSAGQAMKVNLRPSTLSAAAETVEQALRAYRA